MTEDFLAQVRAALDVIPHRSACAVHVEPIFSAPCSCDRFERIAQRVAAAIREAACEGVYESKPDSALESGLRALADSRPLSGEQP